MKTYEAYRDGFGRVLAIDSEQDANGRRVFDKESEACHKAISDNLDSIGELLALNAKLQRRMVEAIVRETSDAVSREIAASAGGEG